MSSKVFSRSFLQSLPEVHKQQQADQIVEIAIHSILPIARSGKTSYLYTTYVEPPQHIKGDVYAMKQHLLQQQQQPQPPVSYDYILQSFKNKFPECDVTYQESWIDIDSTTRVLKKGILIDWS
jgi:hypothetical protein